MIQAADQDVIEGIRACLGGFPGWTDLAVQEEDVGADARIRAKVGGVDVEFLLEVKGASLDPKALQKLRKQLKKRNMPMVLGMAWIPAQRGRTLRESGINYLDTAGNAFLDLPGLQVYRETNDQPAVDPVRKRPPGGAFNASAVRVGLQLLMDPPLVGSNLRAIAALAGVSAPSAKFALDAFKADGYVVEIGRKGRELVEREAFLRKWAHSYNLNYRPKYALGTYSTEIDAMVLDGFQACWGGEPAADLLTGNLKPAATVVYSHSGKIGPLVAGNRLRPDSRGVVHLVAACWETRQQEPQGTAPAFVVFADLLDTRDPRCIEVAEGIFDTLLKQRLLVRASRRVGQGV